MRDWSKGGRGISLFPSFRVKSRSGVWYHECLQSAHATRRPLAPRSSGMRANVVAHRPHRTYVSGNSNETPYFAWLLVITFLAGSSSVATAAVVEGAATAVLDSVVVVAVVAVSTGAAGGVSTTATGGGVAAVGVVGAVVCSGAGGWVVLNNLD